MCVLCWGWHCLAPKLQEACMAVLLLQLDAKPTSHAFLMRVFHTPLHPNSEHKAIRDQTQKGKPKSITMFKKYTNTSLAGIKISTHPLENCWSLSATDEDVHTL